MINVQTLKGFRDFLPPQMRKRQYVVNALKQVFESFGFEPLETPALEYEEILLGKYGDEGDKLMYRFIDNGERKVALRYDQTVPLAKVVAQYQNQLPIPFKRYQIQPVWRAENTQKGRFREFLQCDIDTVGIVNPLADAEIIEVAIKSLETLGFKNFKVLMNDRNVFYANEGYKFEFNYIRTLDKLKKIGKEAVISELIEKGADKNWANEALNYLELLKKIPPPLPIFPALEELGIPKNLIEFTPTLARGLNYYTGTIFEIEIAGYEAGSVCGGGRYDNLIGMFTSNPIPAVGFAFGFDRLIEAMDQLNLFPKDLTTTRVLVTIFSKELLNKSLAVGSTLRAQGINTETWLDPETKLDKQLKYADQKQIPFVVIIGPDEAENNTVTLKSLKTQIQTKLSLDELVSKLSS